MVIAVTELQLKGLKYYFKAIALSVKARNEAVQARGNLGVKTFGKGFKTLNTITVWDTVENLRAYVKAPYHMEAMKQTKLVASAVYSMHFEAEAIPGKKAALKMLHEAESLKYSATK